MAVDGGSARDGDSCFHDFLEPPLTPTPVMGDKNGDGVSDVSTPPWLAADPDQCGDIAAGTQIFKTMPRIRIACVDSNNNGTVDASACTSWDNNAVTNCASINEAVPGTNAKCGCAIVETGIPMGTIPSPTPSPPPPPVPAVPPGVLVALASLAGGGALLLRRRGR